MNPGFAGYYSDVTGTAPNRVFTTSNGTINGQAAGAVLYYDGVGWTRQVIPAGTPPLRAIWAAPTGEVFAVGDYGTIIKGP
jgi:hypothetical protein